jgi:hypothetical protein
MNNRPFGGRSSDTYSHPIDKLMTMMMMIIIIVRFCEHNANYKTAQK